MMYLFGSLVFQVRKWHEIICKFIIKGFFGISVSRFISSNTNLSRNPCKNFLLIYINFMQHILCLYQHKMVSLFLTFLALAKRKVNLKISWIFFLGIDMPVLEQIRLLADLVCKQNSDISQSNREREICGNSLHCCSSNLLVDFGASVKVWTWFSCFDVISRNASW